MSIASVDIANKRAAEILEKAKSVFAHNGFDGTSMQHLAKATQMSVGNFYRYFPSKQAIIAALIKQHMVRMEDFFMSIQIADDPGKMFMHCVEELLDTATEVETSLRCEIQAALWRSSEFAALKGEMEFAIRSHLIATLGRIHGDESAQAQMEYETRSHFIMLLMHGFMQRKHCPGQMANAEQIGRLRNLIIARLREAVFTPPHDKKEIRCA